ncbi:MAG: four-carbon acid sugar kinase family protein [Terriglobales bacterium]
MKPIFCAVADDHTGATDLAGMLSGEGLRTVVVLEGPIERWAEGFEAVIVGTGSRALCADEAYSRTRQAVHDLHALEPRVIAIKYCSTFDSTAEGNIGQSLDAALDETGQPFTVALSALPINGRTTYMGHHFVYRQLLSESPMRDHPLTPMRNPDLVSHLQSQTHRKVGLAEYPVTLEKLQRLREQGCGMAILDCISDADLDNVCQVIANLPLISGSSALGMKLPTVWRQRGWWSPQGNTLRLLSGRGSGYLIVAGSCSHATSAQNRWLEQHGVRACVFDPLLLLAGEAKVPAPTPGSTVLLRTASTPSDIESVRKWAAEAGVSPAEAGLRIAYALARIALQFLEAAPPAGLIVSGGETAGAIGRTMEMGALEVGRNIEPGVPLCRSLGRFQIPLVLKSGNFGSVDFYGRAIETIKQLT